MGRVVAVHQPECFPWLGFVDKALRCDVFVLLDDVQFEKNYFHNRNKVRTTQGSAWVTVPTTARLGQRIDEVETAQDQRWRQKHLATWTQSYASAPFAEQRLSFLRDLYSKDWPKLVDFNLAIIDETFRAFGVKAEVIRSSALACPGASSEKLLGLCQKLAAETYFSGISGREYLDESIFKRAGVKVEYQEFHHPVYAQRFEPFMPCMSSWDLLFLKGSEARALLLDPSAPRLEKAFL